MVWCFDEPYLIDRNFCIYYCFHRSPSSRYWWYSCAYFWISLYGNNIISGAIIPTSASISLHFYSIWEAAPVDEWLYNGGPYELIVLHILLGVACYLYQKQNRNNTHKMHVIYIFNRFIIHKIYDTCFFSHHWTMVDNVFQELLYWWFNSLYIY